MKTVDEIRDAEWQESVIENVEREKDNWFYVTHNDGWTLGVQTSDIEPKAGDTIRTYGRGIGYEVRGIAINGHVVRYESDADMRARHARELAASDQKKRDEAVANRTENDARIAALTQEFQNRIARLRRNNPDFEWDHQPYELFICEQAVVIANAFSSNVEELKDWSKLDWSDQKKRVPGLDEGHSGNTFGAASRLAWLFLTKPELVELEHGALCPLVGCTAYGCYASDQVAA